ncbi:hypothetical protein Vsou_00190 [Vulcanisaeta souniana JCM 11219]|uniref:Uncharacterized protein n=1 Tax=Vulcanisaeta souniana JCM 11219 TaxID=1293586 RepID=A0ABM8BIY7_9CREN|nr:hypothetical protein Vsou_00190 [Vulcanisaeta souniana JCM 11219]
MPPLIKNLVLKKLSKLKKNSENGAEIFLGDL